MPEEPRQQHPEKPGELVKVADNPGYEKGLNGWKSGPKLKEHQPSDGFRFYSGDVGMVIAVWNAAGGQSTYCASRWFCVMVAGKGIAWFPLGWILTVDSSPYAECLKFQQERAHGQGYSYYSGWGGD
jgi:hypothetical protein